MGVARVCGSIRREMGGIVSCYLGKVWLLDTYYLGSERCIMVFTTQYTSFASILRHRLPCCENTRRQCAIGFLCITTRMALALLCRVVVGGQSSRGQMLASSIM
jgi:hypothetical protein